MHTLVYIATYAYTMYIPVATHMYSYVHTYIFGVDKNVIEGFRVIVALGNPESVSLTVCRQVVGLSTQVAVTQVK